MKKTLLALPILLLFLVSGCTKDDIPTQISILGEMKTGIAIDFELIGEFNKKTEFRWDFESDGTWEVDYALSNKATHNFSTAGDYTVKVEVKSPDGEANTYLFDITIAQG